MPRILFMRARLGGLVALLAVAVALGATHPGAALLLAPALALFAILLLGYRPGERLIERMRGRRFAPRMARAPRTLTVRRVVVVRRMMSAATSALAMRPPPAASALIS